MEPHEQILRNEFGRDVGLNADWSVSAWCVLGKMNEGLGLYVVEGEDDEDLHVVWRDFGDLTSRIDDQFQVPVGEVEIVIREAKRMRELFRNDPEFRVQEGTR